VTFDAAVPGSCSGERSSRGAPRADTVRVTRSPLAVGAALAVALVAAVVAVPAAPAAATAGPALAVDVSADRHPIDPDVYGMNGADPALRTELGLTVDRWGGNSTSRYSWTNNTTNLGSDWYFENYVLDAGKSLDATVAASLADGTKTVVTVPMTGWVSKDSPVNHPWYCGFAVSKYGAQPAHDEWDTNCGNGVLTSGSNVTGNDPHDTSVAAGPAFVQSMVAHLVSAHGAGGVRTYELDNEPALWNSTHRDVHPAAVTYDELRDRSVATATAVKAADPAAEVAGPGDWGWCTYFYSAADSGGCGDGPDRQAHGDTPLAAWYLQQLAAASASAGHRLLDVFDEHYYVAADGVTLAPAGSAATQALRLRSTRSLWDPTYTDESWIGRPTDVGAPPIRLIPWMRETVAANYPGTKVSISEYNWGGLESVNGALAEADVLGIFGRERLDRALLWAPPSPTQPGAFAFRMYRDYDGAGSRFGETSVRATSADQGQLATYAAQRGADGAVTVMVVNKTGSDLASSVALSGAAFGTAAQVWSYSGADVAHVQRLADVPVSGGAVATTFAANSITLLVLPTGATPPPPAATALTAAVSPPAVVYGSSVTVTGRLTSGGTGLAARPVTLEAQRLGTTGFTPIATVSSASDGSLTRTYVPAWSAKLRWRFAGDGSYVASVSPAVMSVVLGKVSSTLSRTSVPRGGTVYVTGKVAPAHPGGRYSVQQWSATYGWQTLGTAALSATSGYTSVKKPTTRGDVYYRVLWLGDADHARAPGRTLRVTVT
jgi:hypothetical protein